MRHPSLQHPGRWIWLLLLVPVGLGVARLRFDVEVFDLLPPDLEVVRGLALYQEHFSNARQLIITLRAPDAEQAEEAAKRAAIALRGQTGLVTSVTWQAPWLEHPEHLAELIGYLWFNQPPNVFGELTNQLAPERLPGVFASAREELATSLSPEEIARLSYDPLGLTRLPEGVAGAAPSFGQGQDLFSSANGKFRILFVQASRELRTYRECERWLEKIQSTVRSSLGLSEDGGGPISIGYTGRPAFVAEIASSMERDMTLSVGGTAAIIAVLFWLAHKRAKPMLWLLTLLAAILGCTLALGGLIFGTINVVSMGFAAILLGLAVDYAVVHYQEALAHPELSIPQIRHAIAPSIFWAAATTIAAFLMLNFGGLPGLGQLGTLVGLGVALSALIMIFEFLPPLFPGRNEPSGGVPGAGVQETLPSAQPMRDMPFRPRRMETVFGVTAVLLLVPIGFLVFVGTPPIDPTADALRPRRSPSYAALDQVQSILSQKHGLLWLIVSGETDSQVARRLADVQAILERAISNGVLTGFTLPVALWPRAEFQFENRATARWLADQQSAIQRAATNAGFAERSLVLTEGILRTWRVANAASNTFWPTNPMSQWILDKFTARAATNNYALGILTPKSTGAVEFAELKTLESQLPREGVWLSGWELLGHAIFARVRTNFWKVLVPMVLLVLLSLWLAFRRGIEISLSLAALLMSGLCLLAVMSMLGWKWNLLNMMAVPLILGTGVDYGIFMQLALRRHGGDLRLAHFAVGRALLLCGGTAIAGFGSLALSSNAGMASLGQVCAVGIACNVFIAVYLLPTWWRVVTRPTRNEARSDKSQTRKERSSW